MVHERVSPAQTVSDGLGPVRMCIGCRERAAKSALLRVVVGTNSEGQPAVVVDRSKTAHGRGAHLHPTADCFALAERRRAFIRALRAQVGLDASPVAQHLDALSSTVINRPETGAPSS